MTMPGPGRANPQRIFSIGLLVSALIVVLGSVLTWVTVEAVTGDSLSESGLEGDGVITLILGLGIGAIAFLALSDRATRRWLITSTVLAALCLVVAIIDIADVSSADDGTGGLVTASVGIGLWLVLVGSITGLIDSILLMVRGAPTAVPEEA